MKRVGEKTSEKIDCLGIRKTGKVVYVHPAGRFYTVEFESLGGQFRESFTEVNYERSICRALPAAHHTPWSR